MAKKITFEGEQEESYRNNSRLIQGLRKELKEFFISKKIEGGTSENPAFSKFASQKGTAIFMVSPLQKIDIKHFRDSLKRAGVTPIKESKHPEDNTKHIFEFDPTSISSDYML